MKRHIKQILSAMTAAAVCAVNVSAFTASSGVIIDHDGSGSDNGYYYEYSNSDKDSDTFMSLENGGNFKCSWDNDENFTASRGLKFASPVKYSELGSIGCEYWKMAELESYSDDSGYARFGIRVRNTEGDIFTIMETDNNSDSERMHQKDDGYKKIGELTSYEIMHDIKFGVPVEGDRNAVGYEIYSHDSDGGGQNILCTRSKSLSLNNYTEEDRIISISDKLDAIEELGYDIGEVTDIMLFFEASHSKGEATIYLDDLTIDNMPESAPDEYDKDQPLIVTGNYEGTRDGYYYYMRNPLSGKMDVKPPSLFSAEWDARENGSDIAPFYERGKQFEPGQDYTALSNSSIEYSMNVKGKGRFCVNTHAVLDGPHSSERYYKTDIYIVDACQDWEVPDDAEYMGKIKVNGIVYDAYYYMSGFEGTGKPTDNPIYYFINRDAEKNAEKGTFTANHQLKPFIDRISERDEMLGNPSKLVVQVDCGNSFGNAELIKNNIVLSDYIKDERGYERAFRQLYLDDYTVQKMIGDLTYKVGGQYAEMSGYAGEELKCSWNVDSEVTWMSVCRDRQHLFRVTKDYMPFGWGNYSQQYVTADSAESADGEHKLISYNIDVGPIFNEKKNSNYVIGATFVCRSRKVNDDGTYAQGGWGIIYDNYNIVVADVMMKEPSTDIFNILDNFRGPEELGTIESGGAKYDVKAYYAMNESSMPPYIMLIRQEQMKPESLIIMEDEYVRYGNTLDLTDIVCKLREFDLDLGTIGDASFSLDTFGNTGTAIINSVDFHTSGEKKAGYTSADLQNLSDFLHGRKITVSEGTNYDLNGDGIWDVYDLCIMRKKVAENSTK